MPRRDIKLFDTGRPSPNPAASDTAKIAVISAALTALNLKPNGTERGAIRDPGFTADLAKLTTRSNPHDRTGPDGVTGTVSIKLDTLVVEVDDNDEVCAWRYEES